MSELPPPSQNRHGFSQTTYRIEVGEEKSKRREFAERESDLGDEADAEARLG